MTIDRATDPVTLQILANHCAAATENFIALEHHSVDKPWWEDLVTGIEKPIVQDGFVKVLTDAHTDRVHGVHIVGPFGTSGAQMPSV